jgi:hypothetical protein
VDASQIPVLTMNLLQALPKTPLWDRLARDNRLVADESLESNVRFLRPYDEVVQNWRRCIAHAYDPERLFARFRQQVTSTYVHRITPSPAGKLTRQNIVRGLVLAWSLLWHIGIRADYRKAFWSTARHAIKHRQIDAIFAIGFVAYHLIEFSREALAGKQNASFYSAKARTEPELQVSPLQIAS